MNASLSTVAVTDGLVFAIDEASIIHCLDADTGRKYWTYALKSDEGQINSALLVADGKIFAGNTILAARPFFLPLVSACESKENYFGLDKAPHF